MEKVCVKSEFSLSNELFKFNVSANKLKVPCGELSEIELEKQLEMEARSIYVDNIDHSATPEELESFFRCHGSVYRVTIFFNKPAGVALIEFLSKESAEKSLDFNATIFKGRKIRIISAVINQTEEMENDEL
jgi:RNA recognition motif-containing protein